MRWMGVEPVVSRGDTFIALCHWGTKKTKQNARAGGDMSVQNGGCS